MTGHTLTVDGRTWVKVQRLSAEAREKPSETLYQALCMLSAVRSGRAELVYRKTDEKGQ